MKDASSSTNILKYTPASPNYSPASPRNTFSDTSEDPYEDQLVPISVSPFYDDPYMKVIQAYYATNELPIPPPPAPIAPSTVLPPSLIAGLQKKQMRHDDEVVLAHVRISTLEMIIEDIQVRHRSDIRSLLDTIRELKNNKDTKTPIGSPMPLSPSSSVGSSSLVRSTTPSPDHPFDESIFAELDNSLWIIPPLLGSEPISKEPNEMAPKRTSTSAASAMTQTAIKKLVVDSVVAALEAQAGTMANTDNTNRNTEQGEAHVARKCSYKEFMSCQPFNFKGTEGAVGLIRWFQRSESVFSRSNCTEDCKVKFATGYYPKSIEGNVTTSKPHTLEEAINITQRLMDQNRRQETFRAYTTTPAENSSSPSSEFPMEWLTNSPNLEPQPENILQRRITGNKKEVLVKWKHHDTSEATWEDWLEFMYRFLVFVGHEDMSAVQEETNDTPEPSATVQTKATQDKARPTRIIKKPARYLE
nr:reverse transcriptase domain-containing protein [Tanacetum cinerariifolium]